MLSGTPVYSDAHLPGFHGSWLTCVGSKLTSDSWTMLWFLEPWIFVADLVLMGVVTSLLASWVV